MKPKVVAITGASGFLGRHIVRHLEENNHKILPIDLDTGYDVLSYDSLSSLPPFDALIHLAARTYIPDSYTSSRTFYETNIMGTVNCLELCKKHGARMVFPSTYVYGDPEYLPVDESHPVKAWNPYSTSKIIGEKLCEAYSSDFGVNVCIFRVFNVFGEGQASCFLIPKIIEGLRKGTLSLGNPKSKRDFVYVKDVVSAVERYLVSNRRGCCVYNVGTGGSHSVSEVVATIQTILGTSVEVEYEATERGVDIQDVVADVSRIRAELDWRPEYDLEQGLKDWLTEGT